MMCLFIGLFTIFMSYLGLLLLLLLLSRFSRVWLCAIHRRQPTRLPRSWHSPGKNTGVGCHFLLQCMKVKSENKFTQLCRLLVTPWTSAYQGLLSMGVSRQEYWSGVPLPSLVSLYVQVYLKLKAIIFPSSNMWFFTFGEI